MMTFLLTKCGFQRNRVWCFAVNEFNAVLLVLLAYSGYRPCVFDVSPCTSLGARVLDRMIAWLRASGRLGDIRDVVPSTARFWKFFSPNQIGTLLDWFPRIYSKIGPIYGYENFDNSVSEYSEPIKGCVGNYLHRHIFTIYFLHDLSVSEKKFSIIGLDPEIADLYNLYWDNPLSLAKGPTWQFRRVVNTILCVGAIAVTLGRFLTLLRWKPPVPEAEFFAVDQLDEVRPRNLRLVDDILCGDAAELLVLRYPGMRKMPQVMETLVGRRYCTRLDGAIPLSLARDSLMIIFRDLPRLLFATWNLHPQITRSVFGLAYWRMVYRAFFRCHQVRYFWCRDDYTPEHHMRSQELRRIGGSTLGVRHGVGWSGQLASYCHLDFDYLFHFGDQPAIEFYSPYWPSHMKVRSIGTWGMTRAERDAFPRVRANSIIVAVSNAPGGLESVQALYEIAQAFPDRTIYFRPKYHDYPRCPELTKAIGEVMKNPPKNVIVDSSGTYEGLGQADYIVSSASSIAVEAVQLGLKAFVIDQGFDHEESWPLVYRQYPFLCIKNAADAIRQIRRIECGEWRYPGEEIGTLIDISGTNPFDIIRECINLPPRDQAPPMTFWPTGRDVSEQKRVDHEIH